MNQSEIVSDILQKICEHKWIEIDAAKRAVSVHDLETQLISAPEVQDFVAALQGKHPMGLITEVKKASPSAGLIRADFDPVAIAETYATHGAACVSVLTDEKYFQGSLEYLKQIRTAIDLPVLRKDFILDPYQIIEARAAGADCVLLIAECLDDTELADLYECATELRMAALIEIYEPSNLDRVLRLDPPLIGVNNRNLKTMTTDLGHCIELRKEIPADVLMVGESGIHTREDVERLQNAGIHAILVGETLMKSQDIGAKVDELTGNNHQ
ncbi:MAG: indole-3-glycerol phosphate synthase TrpC [Planctomycetaceae bacterium]|nr:indole-3-glycerol phosphate synthase TrpC [Planctomycetaceae bacterium]